MKKLPLGLIGFVQDSLNEGLPIQMAAYKFQ